ncbi:GNAT family N-acetyltransferase [Phormidium tenue FACHB-886]|nr:GNAT family N-acetyltransferase [Phormidium tenue FACHB-886]
MPAQAAVNIRVTTPTEDVLIAEHFRQMWLDLDVPAAAIADDWQAGVVQFIEAARRDLDYQAFVAEVENQIVGSVGCQRSAGLYPNILMPGYRCDGYIWGVYVEPAYRKQGIATKLTAQAIAHLKSINCTHAVLNASPLGKPVYERLGFEINNSMRLKL